MLYTLGHFAARSKWVIESSPLRTNKAAAYNNILLLKLQSRTLHKGPCRVSRPGTGAPGNDLSSSGTGGEISLCITHDLSSFTHISSCLHICPNHWSDTTKALDLGQLLVRNLETMSFKCHLFFRRE